MDPAEPLFQPHHVLAIGGKPKMAWLDDASMHGPDGDLMQCFTFCRQELVRGRLARDGLFPERMAHAPETKIEPRPYVRRIRCFEPEQVTDCAFQPDRWRMTRGDARVLAAFAGVADNRDVTGCRVQQRHVNVRCIAP